MTGTVVFTNRLRPGMTVRRASQPQAAFRTVERTATIDHRTLSGAHEWWVSVTWVGAPLKPESVHPHVEWEVDQ